jgi:Zn-dependent peptidase ImmA (M78 family)/DNA-binding XRE family transcriptional regulator
MHVLDSIDPALIGERLAAARKARGLTQQQAADDLGVARTTVVAMEKGDRRPRAAELVRLAALYGRQVGDFVRASATAAQRSDAFVVQFRGARSPGDSDANPARDADIEAFRTLCDDYVELERLAASPLPRRYPEPYPTTGTEPERAAEEIAAYERNRLGLGDGPVGNIWGLLDTDVGIRVFAPPFADGKLAGLFAYTDGYGGCVAVNGNHPEERRRWTAAHEYAHFLTDRFRAEVTALPSHRQLPESERFADAFARHFLMPATGLVRRFQNLRRAKEGPVTPTDLLVLCQLYRASFQALTLRLEELRLLPTGTWDRLRDAGFKPDAARQLADLPPVGPELAHLPTRYRALAVQAFATGTISEGRLARFLRTDRVSARRQVEELAGTRFYDGSDWKQLSIDLAAELVGTPS